MLFLRQHAHTRSEKTVNIPYLGRMFRWKLRKGFRVLQLAPDLPHWVMPLSQPVLRAAEWLVPLKGLQKKRLYVPTDSHRLPVTLLYPPGEGPWPCLMYLHGGAFGYASSPHHRYLAVRYALAANCCVALPDYRLLPHYPYPAAEQDALAAFRWLHTHAQTLSIDTARLAVGGDSAGGALAARVCCLAPTAPCLLMLLYPVLDSAQNTPSMRRFTDVPMWNARMNRKMWRAYLRNVPERERLAASPAHTPLPAYLPPLYVEAAGLDCLHDEAVAFAKAWQAAGGEARLHDIAGVPHGYDVMHFDPLVKQMLALRIDALKKAFHAV